jgi:hypothetical protein
MDASFRIDEVSELVARLLLVLPADSAGFVTHHAIANAVLADPVGAGIVTRARAVRPAAWADNRAAAADMVACFSQQITVGLSPWASSFDREKRGNVWAYRPKALPTVADRRLYTAWIF